MKSHALLSFLIFYIISFNSSPEPLTLMKRIWTLGRAGERSGVSRVGPASKAVQRKNFP